MVKIGALVAYITHKALLWTLEEISQLISVEPEECVCYFHNYLRMKVLTFFFNCNMRMKNILWMNVLCLNTSIKLVLQKIASKNKLGCIKVFWFKFLPTKIACTNLFEITFNCLQCILHCHIYCQNMLDFKCSLAAEFVLM